MTKIVLTTDLSDGAKRAFAPTVELADKLGHRIVLVHVVEGYEAVPHGSPLAPRQPSPETADEVREARAKLTELAAELSAGDGVETEVLTGGDAAETIADYAARTGAAFIALSTHGRTGLRKVVLGSVAADVLRHARTPVICFPPGA